ncbi:MAG: hypothetical protein GEV28_24735 [Actinophytocola sp.]|uniref:hypothetical protein n=1 Tax=Actinophytocola sp. TaxID=1872138 RepID=UPI0013209E6C|nr:hypothetical protein [Actinophytocola sp.]MPZ83422.1 hypothetical protein [Actinophytocola sp.]
MNSPDVFVRILGSVREHLATRPVAAGIASVAVAVNSIEGEHATVHLHSLELPELAGALLGWADTLTEITASAWRPPPGDRVHLSVSGQLDDGLAVTVYGGVAYVETMFGADLAPGGRHSVALGVLRGWATNGGAVAA